MQRKRTTIAVALILGAGFGCGSSGSSEDLPKSAPTKVELLASEGFANASAAESSPDGTRFYVAAYDEESNPGVFSVNADTGEVSPLHVGEPFMYPTDLAVSCDGNTLFVSDFGLGAAIPDEGEENALEDLETAFTGVHAISTDDGSVVDFATEGITRASGIVLSVDCSTLYVTGFNELGEPAVFTMPVGGGAASVLFAGEPLNSPTGIHVDAQEVAWVMDHVAAGEGGEGSLFSIDRTGAIASVASGLGMGRHGGVSLAPGGTTAVIPVSDDILGPRLVTANTATGEMSVMPTPEIEAPAGVAAAREAPVMVIAGENSIHIATFDK